MEILYEVRMKHTKDVLYDFIRFDNAIRHPMTKVHLCVMGIGFVVLGYMTRSHMPAMIAFGGLGLLLLVILLFRHKIAFSKLSMQDPDYENQSETQYAFGHKEMQVMNPTWEESKAVVKYGELNVLYKDEKNYYVARNNEELYLLPRDGFSVGTAEGFEKFLEEKTEKVWIPTKLPFKERMRRMNENRKESERLHDEKVAQNKKKK